VNKLDVQVAVTLEGSDAGVCDNEVERGVAWEGRR